MKHIEKDIVMSDLLYKSLYGELSEDEQTMLECWLRDGENQVFYQELQQPEKLYEEVLEMADLDTDTYYRQLQRQINRKRRLRLWLTVVSAAAILVLSFGIIELYKPDRGLETEFSYQIAGLSSADRTILKTENGKIYILDDSIKRIETKEVTPQLSSAGETKVPLPEETLEYSLLSTSSRGSIEVTLADSTRVWLNAGSCLRYPNRFADGKREVELTGEAYFEVTRNELQPFIVKTVTDRIEVLGTQFNVDAKVGEPCVTTLVKGCVKVRNKINDTVMLYPGQQVKTLTDMSMVVKSVDPHFYTAWKRNRFAFQNESLYEIMAQLSEWYGCTFEFSNLRLANLHFTTMIFRYEDISQVLGILQATREFGFRKKGGHIRIVDYGQ